MPPRISHLQAQLRLITYHMLALPSFVPSVELSPFVTISLLLCGAELLSARQNSSN